MRRDIKSYLKACLRKKVRITTAMIISFLLLGGTAYSLGNGDILGGKYLYKNGKFYNVKTKKEIKVNYITDSLIEIESEYYSLKTGEREDILLNRDGKIDISDATRIIIPNIVSSEGGNYSSDEFIGFAGEGSVIQVESGLEGSLVESPEAIENPLEVAQGSESKPELQDLVENTQNLLSLESNSNQESLVQVLGTELSLGIIPNKPSISHISTTTTKPPVINEDIVTEEVITTNIVEINRPLPTLSSLDSVAIPGLAQVTPAPQAILEITNNRPLPTFPVVSDNVEQALPIATNGVNLNRPLPTLASLDSVATPGLAQVTPASQLILEVTNNRPLPIFPVVSDSVEQVSPILTNGVNLNRPSSTTNSVSQLAVPDFDSDFIPDIEDH